MPAVDDDAHQHSDSTVLFSDEESRHPISWDKNAASIRGTMVIVARAIAIAVVVT